MSNEGLIPFPRNFETVGGTTPLLSESLLPAVEPRLLPREIYTMATTDYRLSDPPSDLRQRELWIQHAAGFILFQDMREYALERIDPALPEEAKAVARKGIDDAVGGLMMILDGVTGAIRNDTHRVNLRVAVELVDTNSNEVTQSLDLMDGDGMCMGYHGWIDNDFGDAPPFQAR